MKQCIKINSQKSVTIYIKDTSGNYMSGVTVRFQDDLGTIYTGVTNSSGGVTHTKTSGREYGVTVYKDNYARQYLNTRITYSDSTNYVFTLRPYSDYPTYSNPVSSPTISSYFGWRYIDSLAIHKGIDIPKSSGTNIYSCFSGTVTTSGYSGARGYYVIVGNSALDIIRYINI